MADFVYIVCTLTSAACALLLLRAYRRTRRRLLLWTFVAFGGLTISNMLVWVDLRMLPEVDLAMWRLIPATLGLVALCYGLIWESA